MALGNEKPGTNAVEDDLTGGNVSEGSNGGVLNRIREIVLGLVAGTAAGIVAQVGRVGQQR